jgi:glutamine amidotransferase
MIDMGIGNLQSVAEAFRRIGVPVQLTTRVEDFERATAVILPGVGAFGDGMARLREKRLVDPIRRHVLDKNLPLLGICLGMQLLADEGEEYGHYKGLGLIRGRVVRLRPTQPECRVPNMGWCDVIPTRPDTRLFAENRAAEPFYFAHSYHVECEEPSDVAATLCFGGRVLTGAVERDNLFGVQFHPEKSQDAGLNVLARFAESLRDYPN